MKRIVVVLTIYALLTACSSSPTVTSTDQPTKTLFPTATLAPTNTNTQEPTVTPITESTPTIEPTSEPTTPPILSQSAGLGITRADAARLYKLFEFNFEVETNDQGQEVYVGTISDELATVKLTGPKENITSASIIIKVPKPPTEKQSSRTIVYLTTLLTVAAKDWAEGTGWLNESLNKMGESRTTFDNRDIVLAITPEDNQTIVEFTISAK